MILNGPLRTISALIHSKTNASLGVDRPAPEAATATRNTVPWHRWRDSRYTVMCKGFRKPGNRSIQATQERQRSALTEKPPVQPMQTCAAASFRSAPNTPGPPKPEGTKADLHKGG